MKTGTLTNNIIILWSYLGESRSIKIALFFILMLLAVIAEMISISSVLPFLTALTHPDALLKNSLFTSIADTLAIKKPDDILFPITLAFITITILAGCLRVLLLWASSRLTLAVSVQLRSSLYNQALHESYAYHTSSNSSDLISLLTEKVGFVVLSGIMHVILLVTATVMSIGIVSVLLWINMKVAIMTFVSLGGGYLVVAYLLNKSIKKNGEIVSKNHPLSIKCIQEGIGGIRDVILDNSQFYFYQLYKNTTYKAQSAIINNGFLGNLPKPILEILAVILIVSLAYYLESSDKNQQQALPILGALALGAQRLLPSLQQIYFSWSSINGSHAVLNDIVEHLSNPSFQEKHIHTRNKKPALKIDKSIILENIYFKYSKDSNLVLKNINLEISKGSKIGFIGETGSGKSTLIDIIMGLLLPTDGKLIIDNNLITTNNLQLWQQNIAHVPQQIFLSDASIAENIAFGTQPDLIDLSKVKKAAKQAQISEFIDTLPQDYSTPIGENGVRLSGGQRQRLGIARALYKEASILVFDEATSALDSETENAVMTTIDSLDKKLTIIIIAHRLTTLRNCTKIVKLKHGQIEKTGSFDEVVKTLKSEPPII